MVCGKARDVRFRRFTAGNSVARPWGECLCPEFRIFTGKRHECKLQFKWKRE